MGNPELEEVKRRMTSFESDMKYQNVELTKLAVGQAKIESTLTSFTDAVERLTESQLKSNDTLARWKGAILIILGASPVVGPLVVFLLRLWLFGKPPSAP